MTTEQTESPANDPMGVACSLELEPNLRQEMKRELIDFVKMIAWFLVLFFIVKTYIIEGYEVQGRSMLPTLHERERIMVLKLPHILSNLSLFSGLNAIEEGDIVVFDSPVEKEKRYVKRVIAKGPRASQSRNTVDAKQPGSTLGETVGVLYDHGTVYVNNRRVGENYLYGDKEDEEATLPEVRVAPGDYYVLGDNRNESKDSRSFGPIEDDRIIGKALVCFWPPSKIRLLQ